MTNRQRIIGVGAALIIGFVAIINIPRSVEAQSGTITVTSVADITCDGSSHPLAASTTTARWIEIIANSANNAAVRVGGSNVAATIGLPIAAAGGLMMPSVSVDTRESTSQHFYNLANVYYFCTASDKFSLEYAR